MIRDRSMRLAARLADQTETTMLAQEEIEEQDIRIQALSAVLASQKESIEKEQQLSASARAEVTLLTDQISRLRDQLEVIKTALAQEEAASEKKDAKIEDLGKQLNIALARKVHELTQYRSEFSDVSNRSWGTIRPSRSGGSVRIPGGAAFRLRVRRSRGCG